MGKGGDAMNRVPAPAMKRENRGQTKIRSLLAYPSLSGRGLFSTGNKPRKAPH
jgi:hypothetical protein